MMQRDSLKSKVQSEFYGRSHVAMAAPATGSGTAAKKSPRERSKLCLLQP